MALNWAAGPPPESGRRRPRSAAASMRAFLSSASPHLGAAHACANPSRLLRRLGLDLVAPADRSRHALPSLGSWEVDHACARDAPTRPSAQHMAATMIQLRPFKGKADAMQRVGIFGNKKVRMLD